MMLLGQFTRFPSTFKDREKFVDEVKLLNIKTEIDGNRIIITSNTPSNYNQVIELEDEKISLKSPCKVACTCESFKYEFAHAVFKQGGLFKPIEFLRSIVQRPKKKNQYDTASACKHLIKLAREVLKIKLK